MKEICADARTLVLVSHGMSTIREMATETIWMDKGQILERGDPDTVITAYENFLGVKEDAVTLEDV
jgi:ABC-type polysaccharide/polyol phosphate transport system ATPase subunit